jgi:hypothetical protein
MQLHYTDTESDLNRSSSLGPVTCDQMGMTTQTPGFRVFKKHLKQFQDYMNVTLLLSCFINSLHTVNDICSFCFRGATSKVYKCLHKGKTEWACKVFEKVSITQNIVSVPYFSRAVIAHSV